MSEPENVLDNPIPELRAAVRKLRRACEAAGEHCTDLRDAWRIGELHETDNLGGARSNRNVDIEVMLFAALEETKEFDG